MSKRQEKIEARKIEQFAFLHERRVQQLYLFENAFNNGVRLYLENKDKLSETEIEAIEKEMEENKELIKTMKKQLGMDIAEEAMTNAIGSEGQE
jgi:hypothetical protein